MGGIILAFVVLVLFIMHKAPGMAYDITQARYNAIQKQRDKDWQARVVPTPEEEEDIKFDEYKRHQELLDEYSAIVRRDREEHPEKIDRVNGKTPLERQWFENATLRMCYAQHGKMCLADALFGMRGYQKDVPVILWIDEQLKKHGVDEKMYFTCTSSRNDKRTVFNLNEVPPNVYGEFKWDPQINPMYKRPQ